MGLVVMSNPIKTQPGREIKSSQAALLGTKANWSTGTFACTDDCGGCLLHAFCPLCAAGCQAQRLDEYFCAGFCCPGISHFVLRAKLREKHFLDGNLCDDLICSVCCAPCMSCQTS